MADRPSPTAATAAGLALFHLVAFLALFALLASLGGGAAWLLDIAAASILAPLLVLYVALTRYAPEESGLRAVGLVPRPRGGAWIGVALAAALGATAALLGAELTARVLVAWPLPALDEAAAADLAEAARAPLALQLIVLGALVLVVPVLEEALYRGFLQARLTGRAAAGWRAPVVVALIYAAVQLNPRYSPAALLLGLVVAHARHATGATWAAVAAHVAWQLTPRAVALATGAALPDDATAMGSPIFLPWPLTAAAAAAAVVLGVALWRARPRPGPGGPPAGAALPASPSRPA